MKILIADDHPFTLIGTKTYLETLGYQIQDVCTNGITAFNIIQAHRPDIAILDINMPGMDGLEVLEKVFKLKLKTKIILLTMHKEMTVFRKANQNGVYGFILKEHAQEELGKCMIEVKQGKQYISHFLLSELEKDNDSENVIGIDKLTLAERKILELISKQKTSKQIAELLFISEKTVEGHRSNIIQKLNLPKEKNALLIWAAKQF